MNFARYIRHLFYRAPLGNCFFSPDKHFTIKIGKDPLRKEKKSKQLVRKTKTHAEEKLNYYFHQFAILHIFLLFKNFFISLFSASHDILETRVFRNNLIPLRIYLLKKIISHHLRCEENRFFSTRL